MRKATLLTFLTVLLSSAYAQQPFSVKGVVRDQSGAAVVHGVVRFHSSNFDGSAQTSEDGSFEIKGILDGSGTLTVSASGFDTLEQNWSSTSSTTLTILLKPAGTREEVIVSATRSEMKLSDVPGGAVLLGQEDLRANPGLTLDDALRQVPGFSLFRRSSSRVANPTSQGVSLRGLGASGPSRALVLEDGVPIVDPFGGWVYWDRIPRAELASVEVFRGGASNLYGNDALGGVIQFVTRTPTQTSASADLSYGNENTPNLSAWAGTVVSRWDISAGLDVSRSDGYILVPGFQRGLVDTAANSKHATVDASLGYRIGERGRAFLRGTFFDEARHNGTPLTTNSTGTVFGVAGINTTAGAHDWISARVYGLVQGYDQTFSSVTAPDRSIEKLTNIQHVPSQQLGTAVQWNHTLWRQTLIVGLDAQQVMGASDEQLFSTTTGDHFANNIAGGRQGSSGLFAQDIFQTNRWTIIAGLRWDRWTNTAGNNTRISLPSGSITQILYPDRDATAFSPKLSILRKITPNVSAWISGYRSFRAPTLNELYRSFRQGNTLTQANAFLDAERATGAESGVRETALNGRFELRETIFWTDVVDPIINKTISTTPSLVRQRQNLGRTRSVGTEVDGSVRLSSYWQFAGGYQYAHATVVDSTPTLIGLNLPEVPRQQSSLELRYWNPSKLMASVQGRYSGVQFDDDRNTFRLGGFYVMEVFLGREFGHGVTGYVAAENLFNRRYVVTMTGNPSNALQNWGPPVLARIGLRFEFPSAQ